MDLLIKISIAIGLVWVLGSLALTIFLSRFFGQIRRQQARMQHEMKPPGFRFSLEGGEE